MSTNNYSKNLNTFGTRHKSIWPNYVRLISKKTLGCEEKLVLISLLSFRGKGRITISNDRLADNCSISVATLKRKISSLIEKGFIERRKIPNSRTLETIVNEEVILDYIEEDSPTDFKNIFGRKTKPGSRTTDSNNKFTPLEDNDYDDDEDNDEDYDFDDDEDYGENELESDLLDNRSKVDHEYSADQIPF